MIEYRSQSTIAAPVSHAWPILADVENWPRWAESFASIVRLDDAPLDAGARVRIKQPKLPAGNWTITDWRPKENFSWVSRGPGIVTTGDHTLVRDGESCVFRQQLAFEGMAGAIAARIWRRLITRYMELEAVGLKRKAEETYRA